MADDVAFSQASYNASGEDIERIALGALPEITDMDHKRQLQLFRRLEGQLHNVRLDFAERLKEP
jgi:hypothetical protein